MEEQKYYTPALEDIKLGLSCELWNVNKKEFVPSTLLNAQIIWVLLSKGVLHDRIRVPYLTAEQIEAEGWTKCESLSGVVRYKKPFYSLSHSALTNRINVTQYAEEDGEAFDLFNGTCRCVNDLRLISKLLGI